MDSEKLDEILEEISKYEIILVEDPTLPEYGNRYLQLSLSKCRTYMNRVQYYLQTCLAEEKKIRREISLGRANIDLRMAELIADDAVVRRGPSIEDRRSIATTMLKEENKALSNLEVRAQDLEETIKIIKMKYGDLKATNSDIRMQRQLIRDDKEGGGTVPVVNQDGSIPNGMPPVATKPKVNPVDLFDPAKRPEDLPEPRDMAHARQIADFLNANPAKPEPEPAEVVPLKETISYADLM